MVKMAESLPDMCRYSHLYRCTDQIFHCSLKKNQTVMKKNVGNIDKMVRLIVAAVIGILFLTGNLLISSTLGIILAVLAVIFVLTSLVGTCPIYSLTGLSTCPVKEK